jgi:hypothetical protein
VLWRLDDLIERNHVSWVHEDTARRALVGFGDNGCGEPFCLAANGSPSVHIWYPTERTARAVAANLVDFWNGWIADGHSNLTPTYSELRVCGRHCSARRSRGISLRRCEP